MLFDFFLIKNMLEFKGKVLNRWFAKKKEYEEEEEEEGRGRSYKS